MIDPIKFMLGGCGPKKVSLEKFELKIPSAREGGILYKKFIDIPHPARTPEPPHYHHNKESFNPFIPASSGIYSIAAMAEAETWKTDKMMSLYIACIALV